MIKDMSLLQSLLKIKSNHCAMLAKSFLLLNAINFVLQKQLRNNLSPSTDEYIPEEYKLKP